MRRGRQSRSKESPGQIYRCEFEVLVVGCSVEVSGVIMLSCETQLGRPGTTLGVNTAG